MTAPGTKAGATVGLRLAEQVTSGELVPEAQLRAARAGLDTTAFVVLSKVELAGLLGIAYEQGIEKVLASREERPPLKFRST